MRQEQPAPPQAHVRSSSGSLDQGRFLPGTMLAGRYRVFGLIGRGGMGEVYRADDLKLGQAVALKFLPVGVEQDAARLSRFLDEVRIARQISHPNVCRVYDVGEVDGHHFLSMELVDGEDLAGLLRRIGRLPRDKAIQIARQLCAGLAAAHEQGVLHRDLKPANVMIDGRGRARITDFGLARLASEIHGVEATAGTPAFMAPEQIAGKGVTVRSDIYSLGLVLYELCTGQPAFKGASAAELARQKTESTPTSPSQIIEGFDPAVERVILRCLEKDPANRPASALAVAAALPGGDPLAAALAAGETPSPELVAEAGAKDGLRPALAWSCLAALVLAVAGVAMLAGKGQISRLVPLPKSPDVLCDRAREIVRTLGYTDPPSDSDYGFDLDTAYLDRLAREQASHPGWGRLAAAPPYAISFWYRQSPRSLMPFDDLSGVQYIDPPLLVSGMVRLRLDPGGRLRQLEAVPPERDTSTGPAPPPDWTALLAQAGLDPAALKSVEPAWSPLMYADTRAAWEGADPRSPDIPLRIEAAAYRGRPVALRIVDPWTFPLRMEVVPQSAWQEVTRILLLAVLLAIMAGGAFVARRNVRLGRGDRKGALRLAAYVLAAALLGWLFGAHHLAAGEEFGGFLANLAQALLVSGLTWIFYLALEPYLRRLWPEVLVSWVRLLDGRFRDPLVGRDLLVGVLAGSCFALMGRFLIVGPAWLGLAPLRPDDVGPPNVLELTTLGGLRHSLAVFTAAQAATLIITMGFMILLLLSRLILRKRWLAILAYIVLTSVSGNISTSNPYLDVAAGVLFNGLYLVLLFRLGLLSLVAATTTFSLLFIFPLTFDTTAWYAGSTLIPLTALAALAVYAFRISLGGRAALGDAMAPET